MENKNNFKGSNKVVCVYKDKKANLYTAPLLFDSEETALRHFDNLSYKDVNVCDYDLYLLGFYNDLFGNIELLQNGEKYLLRAGDYYYDYVSKLKDFTNQALELKKIYREKLNQMTEFAKSCYKDIFVGEFDSVNDEDFDKAFDYFLRNEYLNKGENVDE